MSDSSGKAVIEDGVIIIRAPIDRLASVMEGAWALGVLDVRYKIIDAHDFAKDLVHELNREDEQGTTRIHKMFDGAISEAINQGAFGIEEYEDQNA